MADTSKERDAVKHVYLSPNWHERVDRMPDDQLMAIYKRLKDQGKIK